MLWRSSLLAVGFMAVVTAPLVSTTWAQDESREDRFFRFLDRDNDGRIAGEELSRLDDRMKERLREAGLNPDREISRESFVSGMQRRQSDRDSGDRRGSDGGGDRGRSSGGSAPKPAPKAKVILKLPTNYAAFDKDGDNQIGLYEWDRTRFTEFLALDRNGDGFLTARELDDPQKPAPKVPAVAVAGSPSSANSTAATAAVTPAATATPAAPAVNESPEVKRAKYFFSLTDKDKNGVISPEEWAASRGVRVMFEKAGVTATLPLQEAAFIEQFQLTQKKPAS